jgi:hypothetical protein
VMTGVDISCLIGKINIESFLFATFCFTTRWFNYVSIAFCFTALITATLL